MSDPLRESALHYHRIRPAGKLAVIATKPLANQRDLALAYSPGVAAASEEIAADPTTAADLTARGNLVGVISNGTAVLGLGPIGPLAAKPVMEGKAVLFKKFADIDAFDIEIDETDPDKLIEIVAALEPTFGAINLEDIKAPECFEVEARLRERMNIPVFHDDQHGTAIIVSAAVLNGLEVVNKPIEQVRFCCCGAGAAALACLNLVVELGLKRENVLVVDVKGVVYEGRTELMDPYKARFAQPTAKRTLAEAVEGVDVFMGLSAGGVLKPEMVASMAARPLILALANPVPEIMPDEVAAVRSDAVVATGRSDFPNQVNNVLCFPFIFRGALDVGATAINEEMKKACARAIAALARRGAPEQVAAAYGLQGLKFGRDYIIPKPLDPRLAIELPMAVAKVAAETGVATRPIEDYDAYRERLSHFVFRSGLTMRPIFDKAKADPKRLVFSDGEEPRVLRAVEALVLERLAMPTLIGRPQAIAATVEQLEIPLDLGRIEIIDPETNPHHDEHAAHYHRRMGRHGVPPDLARVMTRTRPSIIACVMVDRGEADAAIIGPTGVFQRHLDHVRGVIGLQRAASDFSTVHALVLDRGLLFMTDTQVSIDPPAEELVELAFLAAEKMRQFGITPKVALVSHSNFGSLDTESGRKMRKALELIRQRDPELEVDGEMHADTALAEEIRQRIMPTSRLTGAANLLVFPDLDAANIGYNLVKAVTGTVAIGPILIGPARPAHIVTPSATTRGILNLAALAVVDAQAVHG